jgi:hypothetical protein
MSELRRGQEAVKQLKRPKRASAQLAECWRERVQKLEKVGESKLESTFEGKSIQRAATSREQPHPESSHI